MHSVSDPLHSPSAMHCLKVDPDWLNPSLHEKELNDPKVVSGIVIDPLTGAGSGPQSTTEKKIVMYSLIAN